MIDGLRALSDHLCGLDSASPEGALLNGAANYIEGATDGLREHMKQLRDMRVKFEIVGAFMEDAADELEASINEQYKARDIYPDEMRRYERDMNLPRDIRATLIRTLRWWEPGTKEPVSISHWGIVE
jgi:hypothetical protein